MVMLLLMVEMLWFVGLGGYYSLCVVRVVLSLVFRMLGFMMVSRLFGCILWIVVMCCVESMILLVLVFVVLVSLVLVLWMMMGVLVVVVMCSVFWMCFICLVCMMVRGWLGVEWLEWLVLVFLSDVLCVLMSVLSDFCSRVRGVMIGCLWW